MAFVSLGAIALHACGDGNDGVFLSRPTNEEFGVVPAHQQELDRISVYPGSVRNADTVSTGAGTFTSFCATASSERVADYYNEALPLLGWQSTSALTALPSKDGFQQSATVFVKDKLSLTIYFQNGCKGGRPGDVQVQFRLQEL